MIKAAKIIARISGVLTGLAALGLAFIYLSLGAGLADRSSGGVVVAGAAAVLFLITPALVAAYGLIRLRPWALWLELVVLGGFTVFAPQLAWVSIPAAVVLLIFRHSYVAAGLTRHGPAFSQP